MNESTADYLWVYGHYPMYNADGQIMQGLAPRTSDCCCCGCALLLACL